MVLTVHEHPSHGKQPKRVSFSKRRVVGKVVKITLSAQVAHYNVELLKYMKQLRTTYHLIRNP